jgi:DNA excision repair protein ERCC-2
MSRSSDNNIFPYPHYYPNQKEIIEFISENAVKGKNIVIESPTGSGKTIAVLSSLIPYAKENGKKILYLCRTHEQMDLVIEELKKIASSEHVKGISLKSRKSLCLNEFVLDKTSSMGEERFACSILKREGKCRFYKNQKRRSIEFSKPKTASEIVEVCKKREICPYETSKELISECDVVACSYLYVFEPEIRSAFLKSAGTSLEDYVLVLDEAHNLPRLASDIASEKLTEFAVSRALKEAEDYNIPIAFQLLKKLDDFLIMNESEERRIGKSQLLEWLGDEIEVAKNLKAFGEEIRSKRVSQGKRPISFLYSCSSFLLKWAECSEKGFEFFISRRGIGKPYLEILSLEPKTITKSPLEGAFITVHMSGTLTPVDPYCEIIGLSNFGSRKYPSPFPKENIAVYVDRSVSTMGSLRTKEMFERISSKLETLISSIPGNVLVFFPSYIVLKSVIEAGFNVDKEIFKETSETTSIQNKEMIKRFKRVLGVQQGRNSEGQDFPGDQANAVIVVGIPYASKGPRIMAQIEYYKTQFRGWWGKYPLGEYYAYYLPAYRSLNQSAGRAHRSIKDKAAIIFLEQRVAQDRKVIGNLAPWIKVNMKVTNEIERELKEFFNEN